MFYAVNYAGLKEPLVRDISVMRGSKNVCLKADSHYCVFRVRLRQMVALLPRDRKIPISALTQSTEESADCCGECE